MGFNQTQAAPNYSDVFSGHHGNGGVPVLKLPLQLQQHQFDVAPVDYAQVFGGYWSFAPSYEDMFKKTSCWTEHEAPPSESRQVNILSSENGMQLFDIDGQQTLLDQEVNFVNFTHPHSLKDTDTSGSVRRSSNCTKEIVSDTEEMGVKCIDVVSQNGLDLKEPSLTISGISLRTHPSKPRGGRSNYDVEVDSSSVAATSAAAMVDAMVKAQTQLNLAKGIMERTKEGLPCCFKPSTMTSSLESNIGCSNKSSEILANGTKVADEGKKLFMKRERQAHWSCSDSDKYVTANEATCQSIKEHNVYDTLSRNGSKLEKPHSDDHTTKIYESCTRLIISEDLIARDVESEGDLKAFQRADKVEVGRASVNSKELQSDTPQRIKVGMAEREARALADKNICDLEAQKEQAERNRSAESLSAEVKRWATGKEGNLRALLSTLQYILRPDSGWKPIHLTDVITQVAVKKAYWKATLYVHPDKVQQRGANIQQKLICEMIYDLLKDAWNKFNSDGL